MASTPTAADAPRLTMEVTKERCAYGCLEKIYPPSEQIRPFLVDVRLNEKMRMDCLDRTGSIPEDMRVCVNTRCGAFLQALNALSTLQEVVK